jgi:hypothetical protein
MLSYRYRPEVIEARLSAFERDPQLFAAGNLTARAVALDAIQQVNQFLTTIPSRYAVGPLPRVLNPASQST